MSRGKALVAIHLSDLCENREIPSTINYIYYIDTDEIPGFLQ